MTHTKSRRLLSLCLCLCSIAGTQLKASGGESTGADKWLAALHDRNLRLDVAYDFRLLEPVTKETTISLVRALNDRDPFVRRHVAGALGEIGSEPEMAVPALINSLRDKDAYVREQAAVALSKLGAAAVPALIELLSSEDVPLKSGLRKRGRRSSFGLETPVSDYAALALKQIGATAFPALLSTLQKQPISRPGARSRCDDGFILPGLSDLSHRDLSEEDGLLDYTSSLDFDGGAGYSDRFDYEECYSSEKRYARYLLQRIALPADSAAQLILHSTDRAARLWAVVALRNNGGEANVALPALMTALGEDDPALNVLAVEALGRYGSKSTSALLTALGNKNASVRLSALGSLRRVTAKAATAGPDVVAALTLALQDGNNRVRDRAASTLDSLGEAARDATPALAKALKDSDPRVRKEAASALGSVGKGDSAAAAALTDALNDKELMVSTEALSSLVRLRPASRVAIPTLLELRRRAARDSELSAHVVGYDISSIAEGDPAVASALIKDLSDPEPAVAASAAYSLGSFGRDDPAVVTALVKALGSSQPVVRQNAAEGLGRAGSAASNAIPALVSALKKDEENLHTAVPAALGYIGAAAIPALLELLRSSNPDVRAHALSTLRGKGGFYDDLFGSAEIVTREPRLVPALVEALKDNAHAVRLEAAGMLGDLSITARPAVPHIVPLLKDPDEDVRTAAIEALDKLGAKTDVAVPTVLAVLNDKELDVRVGAAIYLLRRGVGQKEAARVILRAAAQLGNDRKRRDILRSGLLSEDVLPAILDSLRAGGISARRNAALWLAHSFKLPEQAIPSLIAALNDDSPEVRRRIVVALSRPEAAATAGPALIRVLRDKDINVRRAAAEVLFDMGYDPAETGMSLNTAVYDRYIHKFITESLDAIREEVRPIHVSYAMAAILTVERESTPRLKWWPPPRFSDWSVLPREQLGTNQQTLADVYKRISGALSERDYQGQAIFEVPEGFALVTKVERIHEDGTTYPAPERWTNVKLSPKTWSDYMGALWVGPPGHFRLFMFVVSTRNDLQGSKEQLSEEDARALYLQGTRVLSRDIGDKSFSNHNVHAVVYHFEKTNGVTKVAYDDPLGAVTHLKQSGLWRQLNLQ